MDFKNFIAGDWVVPSTGEYFENRNPADWNDVIGRFPRSGPDDLKRAIASAKRGFAQWSKTPAPRPGIARRRGCFARSGPGPARARHAAEGRDREGVRLRLR